MANKTYQVTAADKDLATLAANLGLDYNSVKTANPNINRIAQGQYINIPTPPGGLGASGSAGGSYATPPKRSWGARVTLNLPQSTTYGVPIPSMNVGGFQTPEFNVPIVKTPGFSKPTSVGLVVGNMKNQNVADSSRIRYGGSNQIPAGSGPDTLSTAAKGYQAQAFYAAFNKFSQTGDPSQLPDRISKEDAAMYGAEGSALLNANYRLQAGPNGTMVYAKTNSTPSPQASQPNSPQAGQHYVDDKTKNLLGKMIVVNGQRRILAADKNGRLYYIKPPSGSHNQEGTPPPDPRPDAPSTVLNMLLGS